MRRFLLILLIVFLFADARSQTIPNTLTNAEKVYGLSKFWQETNYNFVYLNRVNRKAWDSLYVAMINSVQQSKNDYEYYRELQRFCAFLKDGHTNVYFPKAVDSLIFRSMFGKYRLVLQNIGGKPIIAYTHPANKDEVPVGSEIISVNGTPTQQYIDQYVKPYISSSTNYVLEDDCVANLLQGFKGQAFDIKIKLPGGGTKDLHLVHERTADVTLYPAVPQQSLCELKWYPNNVAYVALNTFGTDKVDTIFKSKLPELYKAKSLIIDLRNNGGGSTSTGAYILQYLTADSVLTGSKSTTRIHEAAFKAWGQGVKDTVNNEWAKKAYLDSRDARYEDLNKGYIFKPDMTKQKIIVPTVILVSHGTASAAEDFLVLADKQKHMIKMGENSFGSTGQPLMVDMPGGGSARVCTKQDAYPDGREFVGFGIKPDIEVKKTVNDFIENKDPVLDRALSYLSKK